MNIAKASIVQSIAGRDRGSYFFVLETEGELLLLADGKNRKVEAPKRKKRKHVYLASTEAGQTAERIRSNEKITNSELRRTLAIFREVGKENQEGYAWQNPT